MGAGPEAGLESPVPFHQFVMRLDEFDELEAVFVDPARPLTTDSLTLASSATLGRETIEEQLGFRYVGEVSEVAFLVREHGSDLDAVLAELDAGGQE